MADLTGRMIGAMQADVKTFTEIEADPSAMGQAVTVIVIAGVAALIGNFFRGGSSGGVIGLIGSLVGYALFSFMVFIIGTKLMPEPTTKADFNETFRVVGFAASPGVFNILAIIPFLGALVPLLVGIWSLVIARHRRPRGARLLEHGARDHRVPHRGGGLLSLRCSLRLLALRCGVPRVRESLSRARCVQRRARASDRSEPASVARARAWGVRGAKPLGRNGTAPRARCPSRGDDWRAPMERSGLRSHLSGSVPISIALHLVARAAVSDHPADREHRPARPGVAPPRVHARRADAAAASGRARAARRRAGADAADQPVDQRADRGARHDRAGDRAAAASRSRTSAACRRARRCPTASGWSSARRPCPFGRRIRRARAVRCASPICRWRRARSSTCVPSIPRSRVPRATKGR